MQIQGVKEEEVNPSAIIAYSREVGRDNAEFSSANFLLSFVYGFYDVSK